MSKRVTIQDIADALRISRNTVSKAINNMDGVADATREKILQKAVEMGYKQFSNVGVLSGSLPSHDESEQEDTFRGEIALLTGSFLNHSHFASPMLDIIQNEFSKLGYVMNTHRVTEENLASGTLPVTVHLDQVKGLLCIELFDWAYDSMLCDLGLPILFVDGPAKVDGRSLPADQLYMNNTTAITQFVRDMLDSGRNRIGFVGEQHHCQSFFERYCACYLAMSLAGNPMEDRFTINYHNLEELRDAIDAMEELPDVFVCANDFAAWDTMYALAAVGKQVPEDVMICGFDDSAESRFSKPPMTTVHIHSRAMAFSAVELLISRINAPSLNFRTIYTETDLIYRESAK